MERTVEVSRAESGNELLCIATFLPVRRWRNILAFFMMTSRVQKQLRATPGLIRYGLRTDLPYRHFWTYTVWTDRESADAFVQVEPHLTAVAKFKEWAGEGAAFVEWQSEEGAINWTEALERLRSPTFYYKTRPK